MHTYGTKETKEWRLRRDSKNVAAIPFLRQCQSKHVVCAWTLVWKMDMP